MSEIELDYGAISIDTSVFENHGITIERGLFRQLDQFKGSPVVFAIPDIVHHEVRKHLIDKIKDSRSKVTKALKASGAHLMTTDGQVSDAKGLLFGDGEDEEIVEKRLNNFYKITQAELISSAKYADVSRLIGLYFEGEPPFEVSGEKKSEFPDALALLALECWAEENNLNVLTVSTDKGWKRFGETSNRIDVVENLADAISHFQPHSKVNSIIANIREDALLEGQNPVLEMIEHAIITSLDSADIEVEANSSFYFEEDEIYATYIEHKIKNDEQGLARITIIKIEKNLIVLQVTVDVSCEVFCTFNLSVKDSIDKDYVGLGSTCSSQEETYETDILVSLSGDFSSGLENVEVIEVEVLDTISYVDFGYIELDWGDYEE
jgi:PIN domain